MYNQLELWHQNYIQCIYCEIVGCQSNMGILLVLTCNINCYIYLYLMDVVQILSYLTFQTLLNHMSTTKVSMTAVLSMWHHFHHTLLPSYKNPEQMYIVSMIFKTVHIIECQFNIISGLFLYTLCGNHLNHHWAACDVPPEKTNITFHFQIFKLGNIIKILENHVIWDCKKNKNCNV